MKCTVVGNVTIDVVKTRTSSVKKLGGGSYYSALALSRFCKVNLVSSIGRDFPLEWKRKLEDLFEVTFLEADRTTSFLLDYTKKPRRIVLLEKGGTIEVPTVKRGLIVLNPVVGELKFFKIPGKVAFTADLQGFLRKAKPGNEVKLMKRNLSFLNGAKVIHGETTEVEMAEGLDATSIGILVASMGESGGKVLVSGYEYRYTHPKVSIVDATGAGDILLGALSYYTMKKSSLDAMRLSVAFTLLFLERRTVFFPLSEVRKWAKFVSISPVRASE